MIQHDSTHEVALNWYLLSHDMLLPVESNSKKSLCWVKLSKAIKNKLPMPTRIGPQPDTYLHLDCLN